MGVPRVERGPPSESKSKEANIPGSLSGTPRPNGRAMDDCAVSSRQPSSNPTSHTFHVCRDVFEHQSGLKSRAIARAKDARTHLHFF